MMELNLNDVSVVRDSRHVLQHASTSLTPGELVVLVGPNGAGKSTLLKAALGLLPVTGGAVMLNRQPIEQLSTADRARQIAYLPQLRPLAWPLRVRDTVALGRYAWGAEPAKLSPSDQEVVASTMQACHIDHLADRRMDQLSGGELARVHCARAFAATAPLLLADEPVASLDPHHQFQIMTLIRQAVDNGCGALVIMHDISLAAQYADRMIWLKEGRITADGPVTETLTEARMADIFGVTAQIITDSKPLSVTITGPSAQA